MLEFILLVKLEVPQNIIWSEIPPTGQLDGSDQEPAKGEDSTP